MDLDDALRSALGVFFQYGYRKTSMDDVARAIGVSRQWVYQQFANKDALFNAAVERALADMLDGARDGVRSNPDDLEASLVAGFDGWCGRHIETLLASPHAAEIMEVAGSAFAGQIVETTHAMEKALAARIRRAGLALPRGITPDDIARTLSAASAGIKHTVSTREAYLAEITVAVRVALAGREEDTR